jgi:hypothetical protein
MYDFLFGKIYPVVSDLALLIFLFDLIIALPISFFRKARVLSGNTILYSSWVFGLQLWLSGLMLTWQIWGLGVALLGILFLGVGVVPIAMLATLFNGKWFELLQLILSLVLVFGSRLLGAYIVSKSIKHETIYSQSNP